MGVLGLWQILESVGHPIKLEGLEGKRLGVDANVWLYKFIRGFREKDNASSIDSHKLGLYNRISKLLFYKIKPIFVFDGPAPVLKRRTLEKRQNVRNKHLAKVQDAAFKLLAEQLRGQCPGANIDNLMIPLPTLRSHNLVAAEKFTDEDRDLFYLPPETRELDDDSDDDNSDVVEIKPNTAHLDKTVYHIDSSDDDDDVKPDIKSSVDIHSEEFANLPAEVRYEILQDIKESRRRIHRPHTLPEDAGSFSNLQLERLRSRRLVQEKIEQCERDICSAWTGECGGQSIQSFRMQSDATSTMLYVQNKPSQSGALNPFETSTVEPKSTISQDQQATTSQERRSDPEYQSRATQAKIAKAAAQASKTSKVTSKIVEEAKELLRLSGIHYIDTKGEADKDPDLFYLPPETRELDYDSDDDNSDVVEIKPKTTKLDSTIYITDSSEDDDDVRPEIKSAVDIHSEEFANLPAELRHEISQDIKESRRRSHQPHTLPEDAGSFSDLQLERLRSRGLEQKEIEQCNSDICSALTDESGGQSTQSFRMQSDATSSILHDQNKLPQSGASLTASPSTRNPSPPSSSSVAAAAAAAALPPSSPKPDLEPPSAGGLPLERDPTSSSPSAPPNGPDLDSCKSLSPPLPSDLVSFTAGLPVVEASVRDPSSLLLPPSESFFSPKSPDLVSHPSSSGAADDAAAAAAAPPGPDSSSPRSSPTLEAPSSCSGISVASRSVAAAAADAPSYAASTGQASRTNKVTSKIVEEAKELLRLFGIPYIDAEGEAEAQCALLEKLKLTEGTITDDSDVWLFGAQNVFRYFFSDDKYVMQYKMTDIEFHIRLTRENLVCFAMMVGSDYTDGIMNIGPVTALEVLSEFPGDNMDPLIKFKNWKLKYESSSKDRIPGSRKREKLLKYRLPDDFPSRTVYDGYMRPAVDSSSEKFTWGIPDLDELREYARRNFGWNMKKIDEKLLPVMKKLSERKTQPTIDSFFFKTAANQNPELFRSKRVNQALSKMAKTTKDERVEEDEEQVILTEDDENSDKSVSNKDNNNNGGRAAAKRGKKTTSARAKKKTTTKTTSRGGRKGASSSEMKPEICSTDQSEPPSQQPPSMSYDVVTRKRRKVVKVK